MTLYIDPPVWPAHGTVFSHLISDASLAELQAFADRAEISRRAFDRDHYDVPAHRYDALVAQGAVPVSGNELTRILASCGLRVKTRDRPEKLRAGLLRRWQKFKEHDAAPVASAWNAVGEDLLLRWAEPHRHYHGMAHLASVLRVTGVLQRAGELPAELKPAVVMAGWFHDAVYEGAAGSDEEASAQLAQRQLDGLLLPSEVEEAARLVRLTASHTPDDGDITGAVLVDADLEILGREEGDYLRYTQQVRADYAHVPDEQFALGRAQVLRGLLDAPRLFRTATGYRLWEGKARQNLEAELTALGSGRLLR